MRMRETSKYKKPDKTVYSIIKAVSWILAKLLFRRKIIRNEIRDIKGSAVIICNHQCALDFVNVVGLCRRPVTFVISNSFYRTLPCRGLLEKLGLIHKQQFQTEISDLKAMNAVIKAGEILAIFPAGLMTENGADTPVPGSIVGFVKWLGADVYGAKTCGAYFVMPKWSKKKRPGRTYMDAYKLMDASELKTLSDSEIENKLNEILHFDAYRDQEKLKIRYSGGEDIRGLEKVLYRCPKCGREYGIEALQKDTLSCKFCSFTAKSDRYGLLWSNGELVHPSDWSREIVRHQKELFETGKETSLGTDADILMIDETVHKYVKAGRARVTLDENGFTLNGNIMGETAVEIPIKGMPTIPFKPGIDFDLQKGQEIYRCVPDDKRLVMKFVYMLQGISLAEADKKMQEVRQ